MRIKRNFPGSSDGLFSLLWITSIVLLLILTGRQLYIELRPPAAAPRVYPSLPDAVSVPPDWLKADCPFETDLCFARVPEGENAASLYLEAFREICPLEECFAPNAAGPDQHTVSQRRVRIHELANRLLQNSSAVSTAEIEAVLAENQTALGKLILAQGRPHCVFETGVGVESPLPHLHAARTAAFLLLCHGVASLRSDDASSAIDTDARLLRLCRDLQPRGSGMSLFTADAIEENAFDLLLVPILQHPQLTAAHCRRLVTQLDDHRQRVHGDVDRNLIGKYILERQTEEDALQRIGIFHPDNREAHHYFEALIGKYRARTPKVIASDRKALDRVFSSLHREKQDHARWIWIAKRARLRASPFPSVGPTPPQLALLVECGRRRQARLAAAECLTALRLLTLAENGLDAGLGHACKLAGLVDVPADPYTAGDSMKLSRRVGDPVLYSNGPDGDDDGGVPITAEDRKKWREHPYFDALPQGDDCFPMPAASNSTSLLQ